MKKITFLALLFLAVSSCETIELDIANNPNALVQEQANVDFFLTNIQEDFVTHIELISDEGAELSRTEQFAGRNYQSALAPITFNGAWTNAYANIIPDIQAMTPLAQEAGLTRHLGIAQFIEAYTMVSLADYFGDVPSRAAGGEAGLGSQGILEPILTPGNEVYDYALELLDAADVNFTNEALADPVLDFFYGNNFDQWQLATNTLRLKIFLQRRLIDASAEASFNAIVASGNYIQSNADDMQFEYPANSNSNPDNRHPDFAANYTVGGAADYMSNWLMNEMTLTADPRLRYMIYRQVPAVPGAEIPPNLETLDCSVESPPQHYIDGGFTFCFLPQGYWGRDHGNADGIPPDNFLRATFGVYPSGGNFDDDRFAGVTPTSGAAGAGSTLVLTAGLAQFFQAEMAMAAGDNAGALAFITSGLTLSIDKVMSYGSRDPGADLSFAQTPAQVGAFLTLISDEFNAATPTGQWDILGEQFLFTGFGMGIDGYNFYRRTGFPTTLQANLEPDPGVFIRSMLYPQNSVTTNANVSQKENNSIPVFWDNNPTGPIAN